MHLMKWMLPTNSNAGSRTSRRHRPRHLPKENVLKNNSIPQAGKRAILYARVSGSDSQNVTSSIDAQLTECRKYAGQRGYTIIDEAFEDPEKHTSGADWLPELDRLVKLAPSRTFDILICREVDRLARNRFKQLATEIELESHGVTVEYAIGQFADTDEGRLLKGLVSEFAEYERGKIRRRTHAGRLRSVEAGNVTIGGSGAPYGYTLEEVNGQRVLRINEVEAVVVRLIFEKYAVNGDSVYQLAEYLDNLAIPVPTKANNHKQTRKRSTWAVATIWRILDQETYLGRWHFRKTRCVKDANTGKTRNVPRPHEEWIQVSVPAIISEDLFEAVQRRRESNKRQRGHQRKYEYALGGMAQCGRCGTYMSGTTKTYKESEYSVYKCNAHHNPKWYGRNCDSVPYKVGIVDAAVWKWIKSLLWEPEVLRRTIEECQDQQRTSAQPHLSMLQSSQTRLGELESQKVRLIDAYTKGILSLDELASQKSALDKQIADLGQAVASLRAEAAPLLMSDEQIETIEARAAELRQGAALADDDIQAQREIFKLLGVNVVLNHEEKQRWADVTCLLSSTRCAVEYRIMDNMKHHCAIRTRLML